MVCIFVAPRARDALFRWAGTDLRADSLMFMTVGRIIRANTSTADIRLAPPVKLMCFRPFKQYQFHFVHQGVKNQDSQQAVYDRGDSGQKLYRRTDHVAQPFGGYLRQDMAVMTPIGTPIRIARKVPTMEVSMTNSIPKLGDAAAGCHTVPNKISSSPTLNSAGVPLISIYSVMEATANTAKKAAGSKECPVQLFRRWTCCHDRIVWKMSPLSCRKSPFSIPIICQLQSVPRTSLSLRLLLSRYNRRELLQGHSARLFLPW